MNTDQWLRRVELLRHLRLLPLDGEIATSGVSCDSLLWQLSRAWQIVLQRRAPCSQLAHARRMVDWLDRLVFAGAALTWGLPRAACSTWRTTAGERLILWPRGIPPGCWVAVVSSRLGRALPQQQAWFAALRGTCEQLDPPHTTMVTARQTATCAYLQRCRELFRLPLLCFDVARPTQSPHRWLDVQRQGWCAPEPGSLDWPAHVSPPICPSAELDQPLRDRLVTAASDQLVVLRMRRGGHINSLVKQRLEAFPALCDAGVVLHVGPGLVPKSLADTLPRAARVEATNRPPCRTVDQPAAHVGKDTAILRPHQLASREFLIHWTRDRAGPWPDETWEAYRDALILGRPDTDRCALAALTRIATQRLLLATNQTIRGGARVVCFTARALDEIKSLRTYRVHRGRWDFEPYGICIDRGWLERRGARPVVYGDAELWDHLRDRQRPFFQQRFARGDIDIDWAEEQEWRVVGNVDLQQLSEDAAVLFVPTLDEALRLSRHSVWPIVVLDG